jgi:hypothetical protein
MQRCNTCSGLHGAPAETKPHGVALVGVGVLVGPTVREHYWCAQCGGTLIRESGGRWQLTDVTREYSAGTYLPTDAPREADGPNAPSAGQDDFGEKRPDKTLDD